MLLLYSSYAWFDFACQHPETKKHDLSHIRFIICGAAPLSSELTHQLIKIVPQAHIGQGYGECHFEIPIVLRSQIDFIGMTETATSVSQFPITQRIGTPGSAGQLLPGTVAKVVKADGSLADYEEEGELVVTGPQMALRYTNNEQA